MTRPTSASDPRRALRRLWRDRRGVEAVEFALVAPVLLVMTIGTLELGLAMFEFHRAGEATRRGARLAVIEEPIASLDGLKSGTASCEGSGSSVTCANADVEETGSFTVIYDGMLDMLPNLERANVRVTYAASTVAGDETPGLITPLVTVSIIGYEHAWFLLGAIPGIGETITFPPFATTLLAPSKTVPVS